MYTDKINDINYFIKNCCLLIYIERVNIFLTYIILKLYTQRSFHAQTNLRFLFAFSSLLSEQYNPSLEDKERTHQIYSLLYFTNLIESIKPGHRPVHLQVSYIQINWLK